MGLRIHTNVPALVSQKNLRTTRGHLDKTLEHLSSGLKINRAGEDAAGLAVSETLRAQLKGLSQAERNAQDGISVVQIAEGALSEVSSILIRMRELSVQAASDTIGQTERQFLNAEFQQLLQEIDRISNSTEFNHSSILNGSTHQFDIQIGTRNHPEIDRISLFDDRGIDINIVALGLHLTNVADKTSAQNSLSNIDLAINSIISIRSKFGAIQNRLQSVIQHIATSRENLSEANSRIRDMDIATESTELTKNQILMQSGISVLTQANTTAKMALNLLNSGGSP